MNIIFLSLGRGYYIASLVFGAISVLAILIAVLFYLVPKSKDIRDNAKNYMNKLGKAFFSRNKKYRKRRLMIDDIKSIIDKQDNIKNIINSKYDAIIVGTGLSGTYAALNLDSSLKIAVITKSETLYGMSNSYLAQSGISVQRKDQEEGTNFKDEVINTGSDGNNKIIDDGAVEQMINGSIREIYEMEKKYKIEFSKLVDNPNEYSLNLGAGHAYRRLVNCGKLKIGKTVMEKLHKALEKKEKETEFIKDKGYLNVLKNTYVSDILTNKKNQVIGIVAIANGEPKIMLSSNVIIATGGVGQIYKNSTNATGATGDGIACAFRAGAKPNHMRFVQFHPTCLCDKNTGDFDILIAESLRSDGGRLLDYTGYNGVLDKDKDAPRSRVVEKMIASQGNNKHIYLNISEIDNIEVRWKSMIKNWSKNAILPEEKEKIKKISALPIDRLPVSPFPHYIMGGIKADLNGNAHNDRSNIINGLYVIGESANTGAHGKDRLVGNSLLECIMSGKKCAEHLNNKIKSIDRVATSKLFKVRKIKRRFKQIDTKSSVPLCQNRLSDFEEAIRNKMDEHKNHLLPSKPGSTKDLTRIKEVKKDLEKILRELDDKKLISNNIGTDGIRVYNMAQVALLIVADTLSHHEIYNAQYSA